MPRLSSHLIPIPRDTSHTQSKHSIQSKNQYASQGSGCKYLESRPADHLQALCRCRWGKIRLIVQGNRLAAGMSLPEALRLDTAGTRPWGTQMYRHRKGDEGQKFACEGSAPPGPAASGQGRKSQNSCIYTQLQHDLIESPVVAVGVFGSRLSQQDPMANVRARWPLRRAARGPEGRGPGAWAEARPDQARAPAAAAVQGRSRCAPAPERCLPR